ncbi:MAG TPA: hypothetical protein PLM52_19140 [Tabrizicola sp.]|nr:hypothetical protein [Tabrizicola sp.]
MSTILSIAVVLATVFATEWLVDTRLGEAQRHWVLILGLGLLVLATALVKASGIQELTRFLRRVVIGAGIGAALRWAGVRATWLRRGLRLLGIETEPESRTQALPRWSRASEWLLWLGWAGSLVGIGLVWTGTFGG